VSGAGSARTTTSIDARSAAYPTKNVPPTKLLPFKEQHMFISPAKQLKKELDAVGEVHLDDLFVQPGSVVPTPAQASKLDVRWREEQ